MKIVSWNINSINARLDRFLSYLEREQPDVLCLQELKCVEEKFPMSEVSRAGYHALVFGQKTYNGVAILTKNEAKLVSKGFGDGDSDDQARFIHAEYQGLQILCAYVPNGQEVGAEKFQYKLRWLSRLSQYLESLNKKASKTVLVGDFNVARTLEDVYDEDALKGTLLCSPEEREALEAIIANDLLDSFRIHYPEGKHYSWWDYRALAFQMGKGFRIDYVFLSSQLKDACTKSWIDRNERKGIKPSDHAPVGVELLT